MEAASVDGLTADRTVAVLRLFDAPQRGVDLLAASLRRRAIRGEHTLLLHGIDAGKPPDRLVEIDGTCSLGSVAEKRVQFVAQRLEPAVQYRDIAV